MNDLSMIVAHIRNCADLGNRPTLEVRDAVWLADEIDRLQAIVDRLPLTEDGQRAVPGMKLWGVIMVGDEYEVVEQGDVRMSVWPSEAAIEDSFAFRGTAEAETEDRNSATT